MFLPHKGNIDDLIHCEWVKVQPVDKKVFDRVINGLLESMQLKIQYTKVYGQPGTCRQVDPLKLVQYQGRWYLLAWCRLRKEKKFFHLSRIQSIQSTEQHVEHRSHPDDDFLTGVFGIFKSKAHFTATIALTGKAADIVREQHWHPASPAGWRRSGAYHEGAAVC